MKKENKFKFPMNLPAINYFNRTSQRILMIKKKLRWHSQKINKKLLHLI